MSIPQIAKSKLFKDTNHFQSGSYLLQKKKINKDIILGIKIINTSKKSVRQGTHPSLLHTYSICQKMNYHRLQTATPKRKVLPPSEVSETQATSRGGNTPPVTVKRTTTRL